ncbi:hypothetical protein [Kaistia defluvii]|uniref:MarR family transcriptional regulator n=1 Tax=Kaistia defluvii TaxID=410841 RepID=A0ABV2R0B9_9HYPH
MSEHDSAPLTVPQWILMNAIELGVLDLENLESDLDFLRVRGLIERVAGIWRPTEQGKLLIALRRQI